MDITPKKEYYQEGTRSFIRFNGKPRIIVEVFKFTDREDAIKKAEKVEIEMRVLGMPFFGAETSDDKFVYLLVANQFPDGVPEVKTQQEVNKLARLMSRLADWFYYAVLDDRKKISEN
jgi:hypothetical protein